MTTTRPHETRRENPHTEHGHGIANINGVDYNFDTIWTGWDAEDLHAVAVWTHSLTDTDAVDYTRIYLEGTFAAAFGDPYEEFGVDPDATWPGPDEDPSVRVRRVWARWHEVTEDEGLPDDGAFEVGDLRWVEQPEPGEGLHPVCVIDVTLG